MQFEKAPDLERLAKKIIDSLEFSHIDKKRISYFRSFGSKSKAIARIWSLPRIIQLALNSPSFYVIEIISSRFDKLNEEEKQKTLIHELLHIPKNLSGSLLPHRSRGRKLTVQANKLFNEYKKKSNSKL